MLQVQGQVQQEFSHVVKIACLQVVLVLRVQLLECVRVRKGVGEMYLLVPAMSLVEDSQQLKKRNLSPLLDRAINYG